LHDDDDEAEMESEEQEGRGEERWSLLLGFGLTVPLHCKLVAGKVQQSSHSSLLFRVDVLVCISSASVYD